MSAPVICRTCGASLVDCDHHVRANEHEAIEDARIPALRALALPVGCPERHAIIDAFYATKLSIKRAHDAVSDARYVRWMERRYLMRSVA